MRQLWTDGRLHVRERAREYQRVRDDTEDASMSRWADSPEAIERRIYRALVVKESSVGPNTYVDAYQAVN